MSTSDTDTVEANPGTTTKTAATGVATIPPSGPDRWSTPNVVVPNPSLRKIIYAAGTLLGLAGVIVGAVLSVVGAAVAVPAWILAVPAALLAISNALAGLNVPKPG